MRRYLWVFYVLRIKTLLESTVFQIFISPLLQKMTDTINDGEQILSKRHRQAKFNVIQELLFLSHVVFVRVKYSSLEISVAGL